MLPVPPIVSPFRVVALVDDIGGKPAWRHCEVIQAEDADKPLAQVEHHDSPPASCWAAGLAASCREPKRVSAEGGAGPDPRSLLDHCWRGSPVLRALLPASRPEEPASTKKDNHRDDAEVVVIDMATRDRREPTALKARAPSPCRTVSALSLGDQVREALRKDLPESAVQSAVPHRDGHRKTAERSQFVAVEHGNRTRLQRHLAPHTGFEDRARHQPRKLYRARV